MQGTGYLARLHTKNPEPKSVTALERVKRAREGGNYRNPVIFHRITVFLWNFMVKITGLL